MARAFAVGVGNWWSHSKTVILIWCICIFFYIFFFHMTLQNSSSSSSSDKYSEQRSRLYDKMERDLDERGAAFLKHGETSQSLSLSDIFTLKDGSVTPVLKAANPPVRANVLYLSPEYSVPISDNVKNTFSSYFDKVWFQNSSVYHSSMFHASHHIEPVPATEDEIEAEVNAVKAVADSLCPLKIVLDRVVLTSTGVLLGCWQPPKKQLVPMLLITMVIVISKPLGMAPFLLLNSAEEILCWHGSCHHIQNGGSCPTYKMPRVISGTDPLAIRAKLKTALPHAPKKQLYDDAILHTSFARLLGHPKSPPMEPLDELRFFHELVAKLNDKIRGFELFLNSGMWRNMMC
ncbi:uncharacterized protein LOC133673692 isoform X2 [Populus nigra]|uniref:uncharacterized protein LOC133673692 isoform X2 n=1 Tax=Populus nigra TaxID=3691 RepID=UPI002B279F27|nr:uncharacterized protein LOC133673692 isoform X2 [Populus nigra]